MKQTTCILAALILSMAFVAHGLGADEKAVLPKAAAAETNDAWQKRVAEFKSEGLLLDEVANMLRDRFREVNFVLPENSREVTVNLTLRNVTLEEILFAMEMESQGRVRTHRKGNLVTFMRSPARETPIVCRVFSLAPYFDSPAPTLSQRPTEKDIEMRIRSLYEALDVARSMLQKYEPDVKTPELTIHRGTRLLIAVGREKDLSIVEQVVAGLQGHAQSTTVPVPQQHEAKPQSAAPKPGAPAASKF